jgi:hypothetical protein
MTTGIAIFRNVFVNESNRYARNTEAGSTA